MLSAATADGILVRLIEMLLNLLCHHVRFWRLLAIKQSILAYGREALNAPRDIVTISIIADCFLRKNGKEILSFERGGDSMIRIACMLPCVGVALSYTDYYTLRCYFMGFFHVFRLLCLHCATEFVGFADLI